MAPEVILAMDEGQYDGKVCHMYLNINNFFFWIVKKNETMRELYVNSKMSLLVKYSILYFTININLYSDYTQM